MPRKPRKKAPRRRGTRKAREFRGKKRQRVPWLGDIGRDAGVRLVVGLGNPGRRYLGTRHNVGRLAAEDLVEDWGLVADGRWPDGKLALAGSGDKKFLVLKPETYMNRSGRAVAQVMDRYRLAPEQVVVLYDDIDIPLGDVRVRSGGGPGGHKGVASLIDAIGERSFTRVRIGVGRPPEGVEPADHVLGRFTGDEVEAARSAVALALEATRSLIAGDDSEGG